VRPGTAAVLRERHGRVTSLTASTLTKTARAPDGEGQDKLVDATDWTLEPYPHQHWIGGAHGRRREERQIGGRQRSTEARCGRGAKLAPSATH